MKRYRFLVLAAILLLVVLGLQVANTARLEKPQAAGCGMMSGASSETGLSVGDGCGMTGGTGGHHAAGGCGMDAAGSQGCEMKPADSGKAADTLPSAKAAKNSPPPACPAHKKDVAPEPATPAKGAKSTKPAAAAKPVAPATTAAKAEYICPMCPGVKSDKPGECPECHMALVKKGS